MARDQKRQVLPQHEHDEEKVLGLETDEDENLVHDGGDTTDEALSISSASDSRGERVSDEVSQSDPDEGMEDVSFGALAKAQASLESKSRKRKRAQVSQDQIQTDHTVSDSTHYNKDKEPWNLDHRDLTRTSKHAPTILSTRNPVTRRRAIFSPPPGEKSRDPRFDATIVADSARNNSSSSQSAVKNYSFLSDYQATEILNLKAELKKSKDPKVQAQLKRQVMSLESKLRNAETNRRESEILKEHKQREKAAIREGQKSTPYYLKKSDVKKQIQQDRLASMGKRARDKSDMRKRKREKRKEARDMPHTRRTNYNET